MSWIIAYCVIALLLLAVFIRNEYADADEPTSAKIGQCIICALAWPATVPVGIAVVAGEYWGCAARKRRLAKEDGT